MGCKYRISIPGRGICCDAYHSSRRKDGKQWMHFPLCSGRHLNCPLEDPVLLDGAILPDDIREGVAVFGRNQLPILYMDTDKLYTVSDLIDLLEEAKNKWGDRVVVVADSDNVVSNGFYGVGLIQSDNDGHICIIE